MKKGEEHSLEHGYKTRIKKCSETIERIRKEVGKIVIGQDGTTSSLIRALLCEGHVIVEGAPGTAKTLLIRTLAEASGAQSKRVQFTVDMLPTDILGITTYTPRKGFEIIKGPIFANFVVADEINRSPPKTQSALLEAMQERQVSIGRQTFALPRPFFVMATQNPIESSGVYPLPEAQIDRFLFKLLMDYPKIDDEEKIMENNITIMKFEDFNIKPVTSPREIIEMQKLTKKVYIDESIKKYILELVARTREKNFALGKYIDWGASPRASIGLFIASKAEALMNGRAFVIPEDVKNVAYEVIRHRLILNYKAVVEKVDSDKIIKELLNIVEVP